MSMLARHQLDDVRLDGSSSTVLRSSSLSAPIRHSSSPAASTPHRAEPLGARLANAPLIAARCAAPTPPLLIAAPLLLYSSTISPPPSSAIQKSVRSGEQCRGGFVLFCFVLFVFVPSLTTPRHDDTTTGKTGPFPVFDSPCHRLSSRTSKVWGIVMQ